MQVALQTQMQRTQITSAKAQALLNDVITFNETAKNPELAQIIQAAQAPQQPAATNNFMTSRQQRQRHHAEIAALKNQIFTLLVALIVVSGTLTVYLYRQASMAGKDIGARPAVDRRFESERSRRANFVNRLVPTARSIRTSRSRC